jgi:hypothetical protein
MKNTLLALALIIPLTGCESPAARMSPHDIASLSNQQLCSLNNSYGWEEKTQIEIGRRNLNCDPIFNECINRGTKQNTPEMALCINQIHQTLALQEQLEEQQRDLEYQRTLNEIQLRKEANKNRQQPYNTYNGQPQFCEGFPFCR